MAPLTLITTLPTFITPEEHKNIVAATPTSFAAIPPVLRHREKHVSITLDPPVEGFTQEDCAVGTLYVIESVLVFMSETGRGFQVEYPSITLHAISRAESGPSIYCQLDEQTDAEEESEGPAEVDIAEMQELIIVPQNASALEDIFDGLSVCASLHPDPASLDEMDDDDGVFVDADLDTFTGNEEQELSDVGRVRSDFVTNARYAPY
ncbi:hypothetical protein SCP_1001400 [Sparassis crispa]|uniref:Regulator of volume decrease after cellular swelling-domain-containing protein n=1 Tax=Sparassis crispa TaxID=139825 RepID=A0A401GXD6_9APHY|nr:hypothetical protein SCP_1001400 [Sparassis crispa]GBE86896.1 hypothetical protein SCP_1001400 [Sparassis crispa]